MPILVVSPQLSAFGPGNGNDNSIPQFTHVFYIMMENTGVDQLVGNTAYAPYINQLIATYGYDNNYFGVTHTSLPNYVAAISGNNWGSFNDTPTQTFNHTNLVDQLVAHHISWKGYMESMPSAGYTGAFYPTSDPLYVLKHDPFMLFTDIKSNPQLADNVVPLTQLTTDLNSNNVPQFVWISPNVCNDM
ncbi:MAG: phosphoesterase, partial [Nitrososphaerota archaeon]|nr:phosphoesterase [Nitrososphaerota archaeon]